MWATGLTMEELTLPLWRNTQPKTTRERRGKIPQEGSGKHRSFSKQAGSTRKLEAPLRISTRSFLSTGALNTESFRDLIIGDLKTVPDFRPSSVNAFWRSRFRVTAKVL